MGALTAVHLASYNSFCVLNRDSSFRIVHPDDESNHRKKKNNYNRNECVISAALCQIHIHRIYECRHTRYDTGKKDNGNTVSDTLVVNLLAEPHDKAGAGNENKNDCQCLKNSCKAGEKFAVCVGYNIALCSQVDEVSD